MQMNENRILAAILYAAWNANKPPEGKLDLKHKEFLDEFFKFEKTLQNRPEVCRKQRPTQ
jgi:hypothetical protein